MSFTGIALLFLSSISLLSANDALAVVRVPIASATTSVFSQGPLVNSQVQFWNFVFTKIPESTTLIHDAHQSSLIIDLLDYKLLPHQHGIKRRLNRKERERMTANYMKRYELGIRRFAAMKDRAKTLGMIEKRLYAVYSKNPEDLQRLYRGKISLRAQAGLADEFDRATKRAQNYLPYMEKIFEEQGVPIELTRLAFVESMFNVNARSKVGASGIWQFMPDTARQYMLVNRYVDERNSPLKASRAAAKLLASNYRSLGTWPLAITAYNHGPGSIQRAIRQLGTKDFEHIVKNYNDNSFGFASRNFYAEFIAANIVYKEKTKMQKYSQLNPLGIMPVRILKPTTLAEIINRKSISTDTLKRLNPCLSQAGLYEYRYRPLPHGFVLFVPLNTETKIGQLNASNTPPTNVRL